MAPSRKSSSSSSSSSSATKRAFSACVLAASALSADAFVTSPSSGSSSSTALFANPESSSGRREMLSKSFGAAVGILAAGVVAGAPEEASASYSAYAAREKDWQERTATGEVKFSNARELRAQLREIAPMNSEKSKVFCPNGPSAAVSPLMENKCGDRLAMPSVYGRTSDVTGNSIPGFAGGKYAAVGGGAIAVGSDLAAAGGFPTYKPY